MINHNYCIYYKPKSMFAPCKAYVNDNFKFFADGVVGLCDATLYNEYDININEVDFKNLNSIFSYIKQWTPFKEECLCCSDLALCGGKYFCREDCEFQNGYDLDLFLKSFYKYYSMEMGNSLDR